MGMYSVHARQCKRSRSRNHTSACLQSLTLELLLCATITACIAGNSSISYLTARTLVPPFFVSRFPPPPTCATQCPCRTQVQHSRQERNTVKSTAPHDAIGSSEEKQQSHPVAGESDGAALGTSQQSGSGSPALQNGKMPRITMRDAFILPSCNMYRTAVEVKCRSSAFFVVLIVVNFFRVVFCCWRRCCSLYYRCQGQAFFLSLRCVVLIVLYLSAADLDQRRRPGQHLVV